MEPDGREMQRGGDEAGGLAELRLRVDRLERELTELRQRGAMATTLTPPPPLPVAPLIAAEANMPLMVDAGPGQVASSAAAPPPRASLENRIGSQWFNRIGIIALLIGTTWFLKYAIDSHWIGPLGRILIGLIAGAGIVVWSEVFRRQGVKAFSYSLKAVGSGVLYLSLWAAFQLYHLMPAPVAFGAMLLVTAWNAYMAWAQDAELLAAYALIGGFATPALLSTGEDHELFLFSYIFAIDLAVVALVRLKPWSRLLIAAFLPTVGYYALWYIDTPRALDPFALTVTFVALFFTAFACVSVRVSNADAALPEDGRVATIPDALLPLANAIFTALALYALLADEHLAAWAPWMAVLLGAIYLGLVRISRSAVAGAVHLSLAVLFVTVAIPLKATGRGIVIGWLVEGAALLAVSARLSREPASARVRGVLRWLACGALALGFVGVVSAPVWFYSPLPGTAFLNWRFATGLIAAAAFACAVWIALRAQHKGDEVRPRWIEIAAVSVIAFNVVTIWSVVQEINLFWQKSTLNADASLQRDLAISGFLMLYGAALLAVGFLQRSAFVRWQALILLVFTIGKTFLYDMSSLSQGYRVVSFLGLGALLMAVSFAYQKDWLSLREPAPATPSPGAPDPRAEEQR